MLTWIIIIPFISFAFKSTYCPYVFLLSQGVNTTTTNNNRETGITLYRNLTYSNPWFDISGEGTTLYDQFYQTFTSCAKLFPIKLDPHDIDIEMLNKFTISKCQIEQRKNQCIILKPRSWKEEIKLTLSSVNTVSHILHLLKLNKPN